MKRKFICISLTVFLSIANACTGVNTQVPGDETLVLTDENNTQNQDETELTNIDKNGTDENGTENKDNSDKQGNSGDNGNADNNGNSNIDNNGNSANTDSNGSPENNADKESNDSANKKASIDDYNITDSEGQLVVVKNAVVRGGPSTDFDKLGTLEIGEVVVLTGECDNGWYRFIYNDTVGFTFKKFFVDKETYDAEQAELKRQEEEKEKAALEAQKKAEEEKKKQEEAKKKAEEEALAAQQAAQAEGPGSGGAVCRRADGGLPLYSVRKGCRQNGPAGEYACAFRPLRRKLPLQPLLASS